MTVLHDSSGNGNDGTYWTDAIRRVDGLVVGDAAARVVGSPTSFDIPFDPATFAGDFTIIAFFEELRDISNAEDDNGFTILDAQSAGDSQVQFTFANDLSVGRVFFTLQRFRAAGPEQSFFNVELDSIADGRHMIVVRYTAAADLAEFLLDGGSVLGANTSAPNPGVLSDPLTSAAMGDVGDIPGVFDEIAVIANADITDGEVAALWAARDDFATFSALMLAQTPANYYHLDDAPIHDTYTWIDGGGGGGGGGGGPFGPPGSAGYRWEILVRNNDLSIAGQLAVIDLELHPKWQDIGTYAVDFDWDGDPVNAAAAALVQRGAGLVFRLNGKTVMSGPWTKPVKTRTGDQRSYSVGGVDDNQILADHVAHPQPRSSAPPYLVNLQDVRGPAAAETVIKAYVNVNCGPGAVIARRIPGLTIEPDLVRGASVKGLADWTKQLDALVQSLAQAGGVGYRTIQNDRPGLEFQIYLPADKTDTVVFGVEVGNLSGYSYGAQRPAANYIYALGSGEGTARTVREGQDEASVGAYGRIETVLDSSNTDDPLVLGQAITTELASKAEQFSVTITALDTRQHQWAPVAADPSTGYDLGDRVSVLIDGAQIIEQITELAITWNADSGTQVVPVVAAQIYGDQTQWVLGALVRTVKNQARQLRQQQGR